MQLFFRNVAAAVCIKVAEGLEHEFLFDQSLLMDLEEKEAGSMAFGHPVSCSASQY
jgi:hypothetical protein